MIQKTLFQSSGESQTQFLPVVPIGQIEISPLNPRKTWDVKHIEAIAQFIERNGFDNTQALKCHIENGVYLVFAGSNRLKAAQRLGLKTLPVFLYEGHTDEQIWRMAYDDNEQADAQAQFGVVDIWMDYKSKAEAGWTQQKIADVLGVSQTNVAFRLKFACLPESVINKIITTPILKEGHCREFLELLQSNNFNRETILCEIIDNVLARTSTPTSNQFKAEVEKYNNAIRAAENWEAQLEDKWKISFLEAITDKRTEAAIDAQGRKWAKQQADDKATAVTAQIQQLNEAEQTAKKEQQKAEKESKIQEVLNRITCGDSRQMVDEYPDGIKLIFTDPPYGKDFQSNRRTASEKAAKIANDDGLDIALKVTGQVLKKLFPKMAADSAVLLWCDWKYEPQFRDIIQNAGFEIKNSLIWAKPNHGTGDLNGAFSPKHERIIFAVKGRPVFTEVGRLPDVQSGSEILTTEHPTPKPIDLIERIITHLTHEGEIIADPFNGSGATAIATIRSNRIYYGTDLEQKWVDETHGIVNEMLKNGY